MRVALALLLTGCGAPSAESPAPDTGTPKAPGDGDGDGWTQEGGDCDDHDGSVHPDAPELCNDLDDDCDGTVDEDAGTAWYADLDGDSFGDAAAATRACAAPAGAVADATDCDDHDASIHPRADENCDGIDEDCDGAVDDQAVDAPAWFPDQDGDGHGDPGLTQPACAAPAGWVASADDCDDGAAGVFPGAVERCDGVDEDCDGSVDEDAVDPEAGWADRDGDGFGDPGAPEVGCALTGVVDNTADCDDTEGGVFPGATETCDGVDQDCDGAVDEGAVDAGLGWLDADGDGHGDPASPVVACDLSGTVSTADDCADADPAVYPGADEHCDGLDEDCDGVADNAAIDPLHGYADADGDGEGDPAAPVVACTLGGAVLTAADCDDSDASVHPGVDERCDGVDQDCDGSVDEDAVDRRAGFADMDGDGYGDPAAPVLSCTAPTADATDCDDTDATVHPAAPEHCDDHDDDCDGLTDEDDAVDQPTWFLDRDADTYGDDTAALAACGQPDGYVSRGGDCDDESADAWPGAPELADGLDDDCDGTAAGPCLPTGETVYVDEGEAVSLAFTCAGVDEGQTFRIVDKPPRATWNASTRTLTWTPRFNEAGEYVVQVSTGDEVGAATVWVSDAWYASDNVAVDPDTYEEEAGLPVLHLTRPSTTNSTSSVETELVYRGHHYTIGLQYRGAASLYYPKNSYKLSFDADDEFVDDTLGWHERHDVVLTSTFDDNAYFRQKLVYDAWNSLDPERHQIQTAFVVVYLNGVYEGLYLLGDHIDGEWFEDQGYDAEGDLYKSVDHSANFYSTYGGYPKATSSGYEKKEGEPLSDYSSIDTLVGFVTGATDDGFAENVDTIIATEEFYDWWTLVTFMEADDSGAKNAYLYKDPATRVFHHVPWDFNHSLGQTWQTEREAATYSYDFTSANGLFYRLLNDADHGAAMRERFYDALDGPLHPDTLNATIDAYEAQIAPSADRDWVKWQASYRAYAGWYWRSDWTTPDEEVTYTRAWIEARHAWITESWIP